MIIPSFPHMLTMMMRSKSIQQQQQQIARQQQEEHEDQQRGWIADSATAALLARAVVAQFLLFLRLFGRLVEYSCDRTITFVFGGMCRR